MKIDSPFKEVILYRRCETGNQTDVQTKALSRETHLFSDLFHDFEKITPFAVVYVGLLYHRECWMNENV